VPTLGGERKPVRQADAVLRPREDEIVGGEAHGRLVLLGVAMKAPGHVDDMHLGMVVRQGLPLGIVEDDDPLPCFRFPTQTALIPRSYSVRGMREERAQRFAASAHRPEASADRPIAPRASLTSPHGMRRICAASLLSMRRRPRICAASPAGCARIAACLRRIA
jgi:hypothetical protein